MIKNIKNQKGFTLIELLVVIAIIAILAVVVVLTLNPAELLKQARDSNRASDFATMKSAIGLYAADVATSTWMSGSSATSGVMISNTTTSVAIATFQTSTPSAGWGFTTANGEPATLVIATSSTERNINGTGWIPINFSVISSGAPIGSLPVDPVNSGANVYAFVGAQTTYKLATKTESAKYSTGGSNDIESTDGGNSSTTFEQGTNLNGL